VQVFWDGTGASFNHLERAVAIDDGLHTLDVLSVIFCVVNLKGVALSQVTTEAPQLAAPAKPAVTAAQVIAFIKEYFVLVSAAALLLGVTLSTTFLAAYLSVFEWHLLWFVQYTDIITFGLLAVGVITGSLTFIQA
jgi:hypothetical protein